ncbi:MAG: primosomal protein N' (replication factor Y) [Candidatus Midichloriaceae bacterium]
MEDSLYKMSSVVKIVKVVLALSLEQEFSYKINDNDKFAIGSIIYVPFKKSMQIGIIIDISEIDEEKLTYKLREISQDQYQLPKLCLSIIKFANWVSKYNMICLGSVVKMLLLNKKNLEYKIEDKHYQKLVNEHDTHIELSDVQEEVANKIHEKSTDGFSTHLIQGETGSGKTEVYLEIAQKILNSGGQVLILLPEILLATQLLKRFKNRLKSCILAEWNSSLTPKKRAIVWHGVLNEKINIVIGARSALFLPFKNLKLIVIDEEHDTSFKQEEGVIYNARDMSIFRAKAGDFPILLSTATPSSETQYNVTNGKYIIYNLPKRYTGVLLPKVKIVNLDSNRANQKNWISEELRDEIINCLDNGKLSMVFINRRGYSPLTLCKKCGEKFSCTNCEFYLVEHKKKNKMICHYCGYTQETLIRCTKCDSEEKLLAIGPGIEKIEEELKDLFPTANIAVLSSDTINNFTKAEKIIGEIENKKYDIVLGTQIIAKGLNFPDLHLVGVIDADISLSGGDIRILERTFQLLYQVAGRAGRENDQGLVMLQSSFADNQLLQNLLNWDYTSFINTEIKKRAESFMPPISRLVLIRADSRDEEVLHSFMHYIAQKAPCNKNVDIMGPSPSPMYKVRNRYRYRIILRSEKNINIQKYIANWLNEIDIPSSIKLKIDIDPYNFN